MGSGIVRLNDGKRDWYLMWSTIVDAPVSRGLTLDELREWIREEYGQRGIEDLPARLARVNATGTSFFEEDAEAVLLTNRAGENEAHASREEILRRYCYGATEGR